MSALPEHDTRTRWPHPPGTAEGPRLAAAIANRFATGESLSMLADDYGMSTADVLLAVRSEMRARTLFVCAVGAALNKWKGPVDDDEVVLNRIDAALSAYEAARGVGAPHDLPVGDEDAR